MAALAIFSNVQFRH